MPRLVPNLLIAFLMMVCSAPLAHAGIFSSDEESNEAVQADDAAHESASIAEDAEEEAPAPKKVQHKKPSKPAKIEATSDKDIVIVDSPKKTAKSSKDTAKASKDAKSASPKNNDEAKPVESSELARGETPTCPEEVSVGDQSLTKKIPNWGYFNDASIKHMLESVSVYTLKEGKVARYNPSRGTESLSQWVLEDNGKKKYYLVCAYSKTSLLLKRELPTSFKGCKAEFETRANGMQTMTKFNCD